MLSLIITTNIIIFCNTKKNNMTTFVYYLSRHEKYGIFYLL